MSEEYLKSIIDCINSIYVKDEIEKTALSELIEYVEDLRKENKEMKKQQKKYLDSLEIELESDNDNLFADGVKYGIRLARGIFKDVIGYHRFEYIRTEKGIAQIIGIVEDKDSQYYKLYITDRFLNIIDDTEYIDADSIINCSFDIVNLIEVGDYVNDYKVVETKFNISEGRYVIIEDGDLRQILYSKDIKTVKTKEEFKSGSYVVGGINEC